MAVNLNTLLDPNEKQVGFAFESRTSDYFYGDIFATEEEAWQARAKGLLKTRTCTCTQPPERVMARYEDNENRSLVVCLSCSVVVDDPDSPACFSW